MDFTSPDFGNGSFNAKSKGNTAPMRNTASRDDNRKSSGKPSSTSDNSMASFSTGSPRSESSQENAKKHKRKRGNVTLDEDAVSSRSSKSSKEVQENVHNLDSAKRRRIDEVSKLQSYMDAQSALQDKIRDAELSELSSRAIASRLFGETGNMYGTLPPAPSAPFYPTSSQHINLGASTQLSDLLRNCGLGAAVASLSNQGPIRFDRSPLVPAFLRQPRPLYPYQTGMGAMPTAVDYLNAFAAPPSNVLPPQQGVLDPSLTATWLQLLDASSGLGSSPYAARASLTPSDHLDALSSNYSISGGARSGLVLREDAQLSSAASHSRAARGPLIKSQDGDKKPPAVSSRHILPALPPCDEGEVRHYSERSHMPLATDEDQNWLSEFLCFVRAELVEVFRASREDVASRLNSKKVSYGQVGIRCRYCAHVPHNSRASRSSSFPSSVGRIYQSLTMMLREHFGNCKAIPQELKDRFLELKSKTSQGATNSKRYWVHSAMKLGMMDSANGIWVTEKSQAAALAAPPFGTPEDNAVAVQSARTQSESPVMMVTPSDRDLVSEFLYTLMSQVQRVYLTESERVGSRKNLPIGLPGIGCRHCGPSNRRGLCRFFPARRRTLPNKLNDLYNHIRRCTLCPTEIKDRLTALEQKSEQTDTKDTEGERAFFDQIWTRLGH